MTIVGERFVKVSGQWLDLVTGSTVRVCAGRAPSDRAARERWCAKAWATVGPAGPRLIDYGEVGADGWFEASAPEPERVEAAGISLRRLPRALIPALRALASDPCRRGTTHVPLMAPRRSGCRLAIDDAARALRALGVLMIRADVDLPASVRRALCHRHLALWVPTPDGRAAAAQWIAEATRVSDRAHVVIERVTVPSARGGVILTLDPCAEEALVASCEVHDALDPDAIREAARASHGWPGLFVDGLCAREPRTVAALRERVPTDGARTAVALSGPWPFSTSAPSGGHGKWIRRAERGLLRGRRADTQRWLRAGLARQRSDGDVRGLAETVLAWVPRLMASGHWQRAADLALSAMRDVQAPAVRAELARWAATAHLEASHLTRAEACVESAISLSAWRGGGPSVQTLAARAAVRFFQGRWADGLAELDALPHELQAQSALTTWRIWLAWAAGGEWSSPPDQSCSDPWARGARALHAISQHSTAAAVTELRPRSDSSASRQRSSWDRVLLAQVWCDAGDPTTAARVIGDAGARPFAARGLADAAAVAVRCGLGCATAAERAWLNDVVRREGLKGLTRFGQGRTAMQMWHDVAALLEVVQACEDEVAGLEQVCRWVRTSSGVSRSAVVSVPGGERLTSAANAPETGDLGAWLARPEDDLHPDAESPVARAAIRYGGVVIAALVAEVVPGRERQVEGAVRAAAAVAGPLVRARLDGLSIGARADTLAREIIGVSPAIDAVRAAVARAAPAPFPVVIEGESGTGKELVARALHRLSPRRDRAFAALNCAALTDELVEAELFGHARGAFTHAVNARAGLFEEAHHGTLFLDEVGELSPRAQAKLLRVLQEGEIRRVGENEARPVDVRVIAATNRPLAALVSAGRFRDDLMFRLSVVRVQVPPLRERRGDVAVLAAAFWRQAARRVGTRAVLGADAASLLAEWPWPGNVRELQNAMAAVAVAAPVTGRVGVALVRQVLRGRTPTHADAEVVPLERARREVERRVVSAALAQHTGSRRAAAQALGLSRQGLNKAMRRLGLGDAGVA